MKTLKKTISFTIALSLILSQSISVMATENDTSMGKEEIIYIMTDANGSINDMYAVNVFSGGDIIDYGNYSAVKMLNTNDNISLNDDDEVSFSSNADKVYYQGTLKDTPIPWNISIKYFLDGTEYSPDEIAGKSGHLEIKFKITQNMDCTSNFFDSYALQSTFTLDTNKCKNIQTKDGTIANVGTDKQISYTILAGKGIDTSISTDVTDFEMNAISINGVKLNLDIEVDSNEITDQLTDLTDAIEKIDDGANELSDGSNDLKDGSESLKDGSADLTDGAKSLDNGIDTLNNGINTLQSGLNELNSQSSTLVDGSANVKGALETIQKALSGVSANTEQISQLISASSEIKKGITNLQIGVEKLQSSVGYAQYKAILMQNGLDVDTLKDTNATTIENLTAQVQELSATLSQIEGIPGYEEQVAQLQTQISQLSDIIQLITVNNLALGGTETYLNEVSSSINQLYEGVVQLNNSYSQFDEAINTLANTLTDIIFNISELSNGINTLTEQYSQLDGGINEYTQGVSSIVNGYSQIVGGVKELSTGSKSLVDGAETMNDGILELSDGINSLNDGSIELSNGTTELRDETSDIDTQVQDKIDDVINSIKGEDADIVSFTSNKNDNVKSVQFVIKTSAIEIPEVEDTQPTEETKISLWQKIINLFKK